MKEKNKRIVRRWMSTVLIIAMLFACVINDISLPYVSWAGEKASASDAIRNSRVTLKNRKAEKDDKVQIFVLSDQQDYQPGDTVCLELYIKNNTDEIISEGLLRYKAKGIEEDSAYFEDLNDLYTKISEAEEKAAEAEAAAKESKEEETASEAQETESEAQTEESQEQAEESSPVDESDEAEPNSTEETTEAEDESSQDAEEPLQTGEPETTAEEEIKEDSKVSDELSEGAILDNEAEDTDENEEEEDDPTRLTDIEIEPGKAYYVNFYYTIDPEIEKIKDQNVEFNFSWADDDALIIKRPSVTEKFQYTVDGLNLLPVAVGGEKKWVQIGEEDEMILEFDLGRIEEILEEAEMEELEKNPDATISSARRSSASNALIGWDAEDDGKLKGKDDPTVVRNLKLDVETFDLKLNDFEVVPVDEKTDDNFGTTVACKFKVSRVNEPGTYYGKVNASYKIKNKTYYTSQAFRVTVKPEEGEMELTGKIGKSEIVMYGDVNAFPKADELSLKISEVTKEQQEKVEEALRKKSEEEGVEIKEYKALDIKLIADGVETEPKGDVKVRFKNVKAEEPEKDEEEAAEEAQPENQSVVKRFFSRMRTAFRADDEAEPMNIAADDEIKADADKVEANGVEADKTEAETDKADEVKEDEKTGATAEDGKSEADGSKSIKVLHLDEENVVTEEMTSEVLENGDIVMDTNHFSIYIVVNVPGGLREIQLRVNHRAWIERMEMTVDTENNPVPVEWPTGVKSMNEIGNITGEREIEAARHKGTTLSPGASYPDAAPGARYKKEDWEIYSPDDITLPNGAGTGIDYQIAVKNWSKVARGGHYDVDYVMFNGKRYDENNTLQKIELKENANNEITIYYKPKSDDTVQSEVEFHDYNVSIIGNCVEETKHTGIRTDRVGINNEHLKDGDYNSNIINDTDRIGVGIYTGSSDNNNSIWYKYPGNWNWNSGTRPKDLPKSELVNGEIQFTKNEPGLFKQKPILTTEIDQNGRQIENYEAKRYITDYKLEFKRKGDNYVLSKVLDGEGRTVNTAKNLDVLQYTQVGWSSKKALYSNLFWPMDGVPYANEERGKTCDPLFGGNYGFGANDESATAKHNWYFGMRYDFEFTIGNYVGPMDYYFRGDDDFWLFMDNKLISNVDIGGIHAAEGAYVDLKAWMEDENSGIDLSDPNKPHQMSVFFMERGGLGSCCYMNFTLPNAIPMPISESKVVSKSVEKKWLDDGFEKRSDVTVQLYQGEEAYGEPVKLTQENGWKHTWINLPKFSEVDSYAEHNYTVKEVLIPPDYIKASKDVISGDITTITNIRLVDINVTKTWNDNDNSEGSRPPSISVQLFSKKGNEQWKAEEERTLSAETQWKAIWEGKPLYDKETKEKIEYKVEEITGYWLKSTENAEGWYTVSYGGNIKDGFTITNTYNEKTNYSVTKRWDDNKDEFKLRPSTIKVQLQVNKKDSTVEADYERYAEVILSVRDAIDGTIGTDEEGWKYEWTDLPKYTFSQNPDGTIQKTLNQYRVIEIQDYDNHKYYISGEPQKGEEGTVIVNKLVDFHELPETGGPGTLWYTFGGLVLMAFALMYNILRRRKVLI